MSAFMVGKDHIDALVSVALHGPTDGAGNWEGPRWAAHDPRATSWESQEWRQCSLHATGNASVRAVTPDQLGELIWTENERSVEARYPSDHASMLSVDYCLGYTYTPVPIKFRLTAAQAFSAVACLEYQSCESDDWTDSESWRFLDALKSSLIGVLPGYADASWEVDFARNAAVWPRAPLPAPAVETAPQCTDRDEAIKAIRAALKRRTGRAWSVTGGRGTAWGWITITAPPKRRTGVHVKNPDWDPDRSQILNPRNPEYVLVDSGESQQFGYMTPADVETLREALSLDRVHEQGVSIAASGEHRLEYVARAEGRTPSTFGVQYWD